MVYIGALLISMFLAQCSQKQTNRFQKTMWAIGSGLPLFLVSALRYNVGTDYYFTYLKSYFLNDKLFYFEPGFETMYRLFRSVNAHYQWIFIISSLLIASFVFLGIYRQSPSPAFSIFLYATSTYYFIGMNAVRQFIAMSICLYAMAYLTKKNGWWKYAAFVGVAALFHTSALIMLIMLVLNLIPIKRITLALGGVLTILGYFVLKYGKPFLTRIPRFGGYFGSTFDENSFEFIYFGISLAVFVFALLFYREAHENPYYSVHFKSVMMSLILLSYSAEIPLMKRIAWYFALSQIILIPIVLQSISQNMQRFWKVCIVGSYSLMCVVGIGFFNKQECLPYQTFLGQSQHEVRLECYRRYAGFEKISFRNEDVMGSKNQDYIL